MTRGVLAGVLALALAAIGAGSAQAQRGLAQAPGEPEGCPRLVAQGAPRPTPAALKDDELALSFVGHATFLITTPAGLRVATDYNDYVRPNILPDVVTMNRAHSTHFTHRP
ncbi:MAG TPA: MBL fold metallo-hydrolase, partial [Beijerinckiaceae bacterium]